MGGSTPPLSFLQSTRPEAYSRPKRGDHRESEFIMYRRGLPTCDRTGTPLFFNIKPNRTMKKETKIDLKKAMMKKT
jgi:hypothetical protein